MAKLNVTVKSTPPLTALAADVKTVVLKVGRTPAGARGKDGKPFVYEDFTPEQLLSLKGDKGDAGNKGDPFTYSDFTPDQLLSLKGDKGESGDKGDPFTYTDFTQPQLDALKGPKGDQGADGADGLSSYQLAVKNGLFAGTELEYLESLKGEKGDKGEDGAGGGSGGMALDDGREIKQRLITSKLSHTSYTRIPHGLSASDIIAVDVTVYQSQYGYVMLRETNNNGGYYSVLVNPNDIAIALSRTSDEESSRVKLQECRILITYLA